MPSTDYAIAGSNLMSGLVAGLLARDHGKTVARLGRRPSAQRLPRAIDLGLPLATRPESWQLVRRGEAETLALLAAIGAAEGVSSPEMHITTDLAATAAGLDHVAHLAVANGHQIGRIENGWAFRRVTQLNHQLIEEKLNAWLASLGVTTIEDGAPDAAQLVLADDSALLEHLPQEQRPAPLLAQPMLATLVVAMRGLPVPIQRFPDRGVTLMRQPGNSILALVSGEHEAEARLSSTLSGPFPMKRLASTRFRRMISSDGAPMIGPIKASRHFIIAGLGDAGVFLAPALARLLAGQPSADEARWFTAHDPAARREAIADLALEAMP